MASKGKRLDDDARAALAEDLLSPCTDEVAVFQQFSRAVIRVATQVRRDRHRTRPGTPCCCWMPPAPTTGTITRQMGDGIGFVTPLMRLRDPDGRRSCSSPSPRRRRCSRRRNSQPTSGGRASSRGRGSSTPRSRPRSPSRLPAGDEPGTSSSSRTRAPQHLAGRDRALADRKSRWASRGLLRSQRMSRSMLDVADAVEHTRAAPCQ